MKKQLPITFVVLLYYLMHSTATAQSKLLGLPVQQIVNNIDSANKKMPLEEVYLHFDKPFTNLDDTLWFKAYVSDADNNFSPISGILYTDIINDGGKLIKTFSYPLASGLGLGYIAFNSIYFSEGSYTIRAYTNWMRNFGGDYFYYKKIYVAAKLQKPWMVNVTPHLGATDLVKVNMHFKTAEGVPPVDKDVTIRVMQGSRNIYKTSLRTDAAGNIAIDFKKPTVNENMAIIAEDTTDKQILHIPLKLPSAGDIDLQFFPEGGQLVAGLAAHVAFKAIGLNGLGVNVSGTIVNSKNMQLASFTSLHKGMGAFDMVPENGEIYTAKLSMPAGLTQTYTLPVIKPSGMAMHVELLHRNQDSVRLLLAATDDIAAMHKTYFIIAQCGSIVCYGGKIIFTKAAFSNKISSAVFPTGITRFTLLDENGVPLIERAVFINHHDGLNITVAIDNQQYGARDSIPLHIKITDSNGKPVIGSFSAAVTDDAQVSIDTVNRESIATRFLFSASLKGYVEEPGYYLNSNDPNAATALDNLLLTQGWVGYNWDNVLTPVQPSFAAEQGLTVKGNVLNYFNRPDAGSAITLLSKKPLLVMDTVTDKEGHFLFTNFPPIDSPLFIIQVKNKNNKNKNATITMQPMQPPVFETPYAAGVLVPQYVNADTAVQTFLKTQYLIDSTKYNSGDVHMLAAVTVTTTKVVQDSHNLNGPGGADQVIDENDLAKSDKKTLLDVLENNVKGFITSVFPPPAQGAFSPKAFLIKASKAVFIIDGINLALLFSPGTSGEGYLTDEYEFERKAFAQINAAEIKGIEVMHSSKYTSAYNYAFLGGKLNNYDPAQADYAYIEITTYSGKGPYIANSYGIALFKPLALTWPKLFYKPKYSITDSIATSRPDTRSTITWEPDIITDVAGKADIWFYAADKPKSYTVIIEGMDYSGNVGSAQKKINFANPQ